MKLGLIAVFLIGFSVFAAEPVKVYAFVNATCPVSQAHQKPWEQLRREYQSEAVRFERIETPLYPEDKGKISEENLTLIRRYKVRSVPTFVVVSASGEVKYFGLFSEDPLKPKTGQQYLREAVVSAGKGEAVMKPTTRPSGCAVPEWVFKGK